MAVGTIAGPTPETLGWAMLGLFCGWRTAHCKWRAPPLSVLIVAAVMCLPTVAADVPSMFERRTRAVAGNAAVAAFSSALH